MRGYTETVLYKVYTITVLWPYKSMPGSLSPLPLLHDIMESGKESLFTIAREREKSQFLSSLT